MFTSRLKHSDRAKDWMILGKTFTISDGARPLMTSGISYNKMRQVTSMRTLESDSNLRPFH